MTDDYEGLDPEDRFNADIPEHLREDVMIMIAESAHTDCHSCVTILERDRLDAINVRAHGIIEVEGEEYTFIVQDGNMCGTVLEAWNEDKVFEPAERTQWTLQPLPWLVNQAISGGNGPFLIKKWDIIAAREDKQKLLRDYAYDRYVQPGSMVESHYRKKAADDFFEIVSKETADETRARLERATEVLEFRV